MTELRVLAAGLFIDRIDGMREGFRLYASLHADQLLTQIEGQAANMPGKPGSWEVSSPAGNVVEIKFGLLAPLSDQAEQLVRLLQQVKENFAGAGQPGST